MPFASTPTGVVDQNAALDAVVGTFPDDGTWRLYDSALVELTATGGYAPANHSWSDWAPAINGEKSTTVPVPFGTSSAAYSGDATYWGIADSAGALVFYDLLPEMISVGAAGTAVSFKPTLFFRDES